MSGAVPERQTSALGPSTNPTPVELKPCPIPAAGTQAYQLWVDSTAMDMRAYFEANRPLTWREWLFGRREYVESCVADDLMIGLIFIVIGYGK